MTNKVELSFLEGDNSPSIPTVYSRLIARELKLQTPDLHALLEGTDLSIEDFLQEDTLLNTNQQLIIFDNSVALADDKLLGFRAGKRITPSTHGVIGFLVSSSPNLFLALKAFETYLPSRFNFIRIKIEIDDDWLELHFYVETEMAEKTSRMIHEAAATVVYDSAEFILGRPLIEGKMYFPFAEPDYSHRYAEYLAGSNTFSAPHFRIKIPAAQCYETNVATDYESYRFALEQCEKLQLQIHQDNGSYKYKLQKMMLSHPPGTLHEDEAAAALFISKRTLARKLKIERSSFRQIRDEILAKQATDYLEDSDFCIDTIATLLNYHDGASFRRAFKRWYRMTPDQYRRQFEATKDSAY